MGVPPNNEMQRTSHGQDGGSPLISVFDRPVGREMRAWKELETDFRALRASGFDDARLDHQHGAAGEHWRVAGGASSQQIRRFEALARMAGLKLLEVPVTADWAEVAQERDPLVRWYRALRQVSGAYRVEGYGVQKDEHGNDAGVIYMGRVDSVYETSATLCATLESLATTPRSRVEVLCAVPRYSGPCQHWRAARSLLSSKDPDYAGAVHEAVSAVEGLCRTILGEPSITLGGALQRLRQRNLLHPALSRGIEGLWAFASAEPGIRHGAASAPAVKPHEAHFVVDACEAALTLLLTIDGGQG